MVRAENGLFWSFRLAIGSLARDTRPAMATVHFTSHLQKFTNCEPVGVAGESVGEALQQALVGNDQLRSYVLDEQGRLRRHVTIFVDGQLIADRVSLSDSIGPETEVYVMQALSGG